MDWCDQLTPFHNNVKPWCGFFSQLSYGDLCYQGFLYHNMGMLVNSTYKMKSNIDGGIWVVLI